MGAWGRNWGIEPQNNWLEWNMIPGMIGRKRLVYAHFVHGRVRYLSGRNILGDEINREGRELGIVDHLFETGANDVLVVKGDGEHLVPYIKGQVVESVDLETRTIRVDWDPDF